MLASIVDPGFARNSTKKLSSKKTLWENPVFVGRENVAVFCLFGEEIEGVKPICGRKDDCEVAWKTYKT